MEAATKLSLRELPPGLADLTASPLLFGFSFTAPPRIQLAITRHQEVDLLSILVDDVQASTVVIEDGSEITKIKLRIRNNTRQYLTMHLPAGATLTHSLIDGRPVRPAVTQKDGQEALLFPLRQSERIGVDGERLHTVRPGETLSDIANFYYADPDQWDHILEFNPDELSSELDMVVGQNLVIPAKQGLTVEESAFVIELAYKLNRDPLGLAGSHRSTLPSIDVDTMKLTWHLYFPAALMPLSFDANLTQYSAIRYDPFRRLRDFLGRALSFFAPQAWAGGYRSILKQRKNLYLMESEQKSRSEVILTAFPFTGQRYRFKRMLLGQETPHISLTYVTAGLAAPVRWGAFLLALGLGLLLLRPRAKRSTWIGAGAALVLLLICAHFFLGVHRRILWGIDLALLIALFRMRAGPLWQSFVALLASPWKILALISMRNLLFLIGCCLILWLVLFFPLLLSSIAALVLFFCWRRQLRLAEEELSHV